MQEKYFERLSKLIETQKKIQDVHKIYRNYYPVTIVSDNTFHIYDIQSEQIRYEYVKSESCPFLIPSGVRAAFPLECYGDKMSAIVSDEVFDTQEGYVEILHEFVHCAQFTLELRDQLTIAQEYREKNDYSWEINHPFPYDNQSFADLYTQYMDSLLQYDYSKAINLRQQFKSVLGKIDREYLLWQEWNEGFARFLENKIRNLLNINENHFGNKTPYNRVSFYESGSRFISLIEQVNPDSIDDMRGLFYEMRKYI
jgi:hypothetical protein